MTGVGFAVTWCVVAKASLCAGNAARKGAGPASPVASWATKKAPSRTRRRFQLGRWGTVPNALARVQFTIKTCAYSRSEPFFSGRKNMAMNATT